MKDLGCVWVAQGLHHPVSLGQAFNPSGPLVASFSVQGFGNPCHQLIMERLCWVLCPLPWLALWDPCNILNLSHSTLFSGVSEPWQGLPPLLATTFSFGWWVCAHSSRLKSSVSSPGHFSWPSRLDFPAPCSPVPCIYICHSTWNTQSSHP